jgi:hypothetical protein
MSPLTQKLTVKVEPDIVHVIAALHELAAAFADLSTRATEAVERLRVLAGES